jgi:hypothetical protein
MTTFTTAELERDPARVLSTAEREGEATIIRVDGVRFDLRLSAVETTPKIKPLPDFLGRLQQQGMPRLTNEQVMAVDRMMAGE